MALYETNHRLTAEEMEKAEDEQARLLKVWVDAYLTFPTAANFDGLTNKMREYQNAWMNGRERP